jgi:hypothetical protein
MGVQRFDRGERQQRAEAEGDVRSAPEFGAGSVDRKSGRPRPPNASGPDTAFQPAAVQRREASGQPGAVVTLLPSSLIPYSSPTRLLAGFFQDGCGKVAVEIALMAGCDCGLEACAVIEREQDVVYRGTVGHDDALAWGIRRSPSSHET